MKTAVNLNLVKIYVFLQSLISVAKYAGEMHDVPTNSCCISDIYFAILFFYLNEWQSFDTNYQSELLFSPCSLQLTFTVCGSGNINFYWIFFCFPFATARYLYIVRYCDSSALAGNKCEGEVHWSGRLNKTTLL